MRCENCSKFVPYNTEEEPEANLEITAEGDLTGDVRRVLTCEECGTELKETTFDVEQDLNSILTLPTEPADHAHVWDWENAEEPSVSPTTGTITTDRKGKKITNPRYMTATYGIEVEGTVKCSVEGCDAVATYSLKDDCTASSMDELT